jgi:hypothetical protein
MNHKFLAASLAGSQASAEARPATPASLGYACDFTRTKKRQDAMTTDTRNPTSVGDDWWIRANAPGRERIDPAYIGKWMLFAYVADIDPVWEIIRDATIAGTLGIAAKVATMRENPNSASPGSKLICVYTKDYRDIEDMRRVLIRLRELGFTQRLSYKTDDDTIQGKYGKGSSLYTSQANTTTFGLTSEPTRIRKEL